MSRSLCHLAAAVVGDVLLLLAVAGILHLTSLIIRGLEAVLASLCIDLGSVQLGKLLGCGNVGHLLEIALGENKIDFFERTTRSVNLLAECLLSNRKVMENVSG